MAELNNLLVAALAAAAEENIEVTTVVKEVQARLQVSDKSLFLCHKIPISFFTQNTNSLFDRDSKRSKQLCQNKDGLRGG